MRAPRHHGIAMLLREGSEDFREPVLLRLKRKRRGKEGKQLDLLWSNIAQSMFHTDWDRDNLSGLKRHLRSPYE